MTIPSIVPTPDGKRIVVCPDPRCITPHTPTVFLEVARAQAKRHVCEYEGAGGAA
jgi:hypothetical protein